MTSIQVLATALEYIEIHLNENIKTADIANACYCSKSTLERLFKFMNHISIHDYITRRRITRATRDLTGNNKLTILEIALKYGYGSHESFTRAFEQVWHCNPSQYRNNPRYYDLFPRLLSPSENGDDYMKSRKHVDISELYDLFISRKNCYFVCFDIKSLVPINNISHSAGDLAIIESLNRIYDASGEDDVVFRIGGDEFALLTNSCDISYANSIATSITSKNGQCFTYEDQEIPLSLYASVIQLDDQVKRYSELFTTLHQAIIENK